MTDKTETTATVAKVEYITAKKFAEMLNISEYTLKAVSDRKAFPTFEAGKGYLASEVKAYLNR